jgi:Dyp-type peroxidase family
MVRRSKVAAKPAPAAPAASNGAPIEPLLEMQDIQGIAVPGFFKPHQTLISIGFPTSRTGLEHLRETLRRLLRQISTAEATLRDRRDHRGVEKVDREVAQRVFVAIGFSASGLERLTPGGFEIVSPAFQGGLASRSALLGDPTDPRLEGHPSNWVVGRPGEALDSIIVVAGDLRERVSETATAIAASMVGSGASVSTQNGDVREGIFEGHEHFGFDDGVSQPGIRGLAGPGDFVTERHVDSSDTPRAWLNGYPGQDLVWPGEFILGYPASGPDPLRPGPISSSGPAWTRNGSFLVYRRLRQDVGLFWRTMRSEAARLSALPGFKDLTDDMLAAKLVGRWQSGAPVNRTPGMDLPALGADQMANNYFQFDSPSPALPGDTYPSAAADSVGLICPWAAHIRKVNVRDAASDLGGGIATYARRLLRVGVAFGKSLKDRYAHPGQDPEQGDRGLLFLSIQASIENQFEFLQARWINDPTRPKTPGGNDLIVGQNAVADGQVRTCTIFGSGAQAAQVSAKNQWVIPTGGGYFFIPSLAALENVILGSS